MLLIYVEPLHILTTDRRNYVEDGLRASGLSNDAEEPCAGYTSKHRIPGDKKVRMPAMSILTFSIGKC